MATVMDKTETQKLVASLHEALEKRRRLDADRPEAPSGRSLDWVADWVAMQRDERQEAWDDLCEYHPLLQRLAEMLVEANRAGVVVEIGRDLDRTIEAVLRPLPLSSRECDIARSYLDRITWRHGN